MIPRTFKYSILLPLLASSCALAQPAPGLPPFGSFSGGPFDTIDNANLNVYFQIPIISKAGRGLPFSYALTYNNSIWSPVSGTGAHAWTPVSNGWGGSSNVETGYVTYTTTQNSCYYNGSWYYWDQFSNFYYYDTVGTPHYLSGLIIYDWNFRALPCGGGVSSATGNTVDGSGYKVTAQAYYGGAYPSSVFNVAGTQIAVNGTPGSGSITDRNGNQLTYSTSSGTTTFTDTLNTPALTISSAGVLTYKDPQNGNSSYTPTYNSYAVWTSFACSGISEYSGMMSLLSSVALPDGSSYSFTYEASTSHSGYITGRIASVTPPTGGTISYQYSGGSNGINCSDGSTPTLTRITPDGTWVYSRSGNTTTITTPASDNTVLTFQGTYEVQRNVYQGAVLAANLLETVDTCFNGSASPCTGTAVGPPVTQVSVITTLPPATSGPAVQSKRVTAFDSVSGYAMPSEIDEYDYGSGAVGNLVRTTAIAYAALGNIRNMPSSVIVQDSGSYPQAKTTYVYDQSALQGTSAPQHVSVSGSRGNVTTITRYTSATTSLAQGFTYFDTGNVYQATDVNNAVTTYTYGACGNAFPTSVALPLSLSTSATWDTNCYGGVPLTATDPNSQVTTTRYNEGGNIIWRPTSVTDAANATTAFSYVPHTGTTPASVESALAAFATNSTVDNATTFDGLGRARIGQRKQSSTSSNYDSVETDFDSLGRPWRTTVPYSGVKGATQSGGNATYTYYDPLGRVKQITDGGGGWTKYSYDRNDVVIEIGPQVTVPATENTKKRQLEYDALGRLTFGLRVHNGRQLRLRHLRPNRLPVRLLVQVHLHPA